MESLQGKSIFSGYVCMRAFVVKHVKPAFSLEKTVGDDEVVIEKDRFRQALRRVDESIALLMEKTDGRAEERGILEAQRYMLNDPDFISQVEDLIVSHHYNAPYALEEATGRVVQHLNQLGDYPKENIADIQDIAGRVMSAMTETRLTNLRKLDEKSIIVADTILPSELMGLDPSLIGAICLDGGGSTSHVAILARAMNIPCVFALKDASSRVVTGSFVALDAFNGILYIDPDVRTMAAIRREKRLLDEEERLLKEDAVLPAITKDGVRIRLECNIEGPDHIDLCLKNGAEGVGLFRTEFLLMGGDKTYSEDEQAAIYSDMARRFNRRGSVTIRTYDVGGDKIIKDLAHDEDNPVLGWRAVRFCMDEKDIFRTQLRAILRASTAGRIRIMFPMISGADELDDVLSFFEEVKQECRAEGTAFDEEMEVGTMIEVPSAAIASDILSTRVNFFSVGTNDLTQYTIAVDRGNEKISYLYKEYHPAILRLLKLTSENAHRNGIGLSMCGEMAGNLSLIPLVIGLGYRQLSMSPACLLGARKLIRSMNYSDCKVLAKKALDMTSCRAMESLLEKFNAEIRDNQ